MFLLIDIGNTSAKLAIAAPDTGEIVHFERLTDTWRDALDRLYREYGVTETRVSCVGRDVPELHALPAVKWLDWTMPCAISNIPAGYGADRLAADLGAYTGQHALLVIDAGTCITYDLIIDGAVVGGVISPGVQLRLNAMHQHTAALPQVEAAPAPLMADTIVPVLRSGAVNGARFEVEGFIRAVRAEHPDVDVVLTGGNHFDLSPDISHRYDPYLVLRGLLCL